ncbi:hypothetical protein V2J09_012099 [Rumex salicifolius]
MAIGCRKYHVLAVDDTSTDRKLIERILNASAFHVTVVDSGSKALEFLGLNDDDDEEEERFPIKPRPAVDMIITDYSMPEMTGFDLLRRIKLPLCGNKSESLRGIPVVILSSENTPARINRCLEEGAEEFLLKPVRLSDVDKIKPYLVKSTQFPIF